jgi:lipopolysaccharide/colanic/teichoic acid biosynthesis glycosyltransferase
MSRLIHYTRRHSRLHERVLLSFFFQSIIGIFLIISISIVPRWGIFFWKTIDPNSKNALVGLILSFLVTTYSLRRLLRYPGSQSSSYIIPTVLVVFGFLISVFLVERIAYSSVVMFTGFVVTVVWCYIGYFIGNRYRLVRYALVPFGEALEFKNTHVAWFVLLTEPDLKKERFNGVIADLSSKELTPKWEKFLAHCTLSRIPVFHTRQIKESLTGRVKIDRLSENEFGALLPSTYYENLKRYLDFTAAFVLIPLLLPIFVIIAILIKLESKGPALFIQSRMGFRGKPFKMFKFRSMYTDKRGKGFTEGGEDPRITKVGKIIRKYRIDELPQIFNILLGQMSFIGPRPESSELSEWYEKDVPFFSYRHVVRPGISGWAQVEQGYAAEVDGMNIKLEYDFYYIKHFSLWLDILITFKTFKTIFTGFGAR